MQQAARRKPWKLLHGTRPAARSFYNHHAAPRRGATRRGCSSSPRRRAKRRTSTLATRPRAPLTTGAPTTITTPRRRGPSDGLLSQPNVEETRVCDRRRRRRRTRPAARRPAPAAAPSSQTGCRLAIRRGFVKARTSARSAPAAAPTDRKRLDTRARRASTDASLGPELTCTSDLSATGAPPAPAPQRSPKTSMTAWASATATTGTRPCR
jgi:hypothetical protein